MRTIAFFDLDGTITKADAMLEFIAFCHGRPRLYLLLASVFPAWLLAKAGLAPQDAAKKAVVRRVFSGGQVAIWNARAVRFTQGRMPRLLRPAAMDCIAAHQRQGHEVVVVTASCTLWAAPWCASHNIPCIATGLEERDGRFTGRLATPNCKGPEKVRRIRELFGPLDDARLYAYGDTPDDRPMLAMASDPHYKPFR